VAVSLVTTTPEAEKLLAYMARVSSSHQDNPEYSKLLRYLIEHQHWSPFEMVHMVVEIETSRAIAAQILRHRSFSFQEFSQRYAEVPNSGPPSLLVGRMQSEKNRQSSGRDIALAVQRIFIQQFPCTSEALGWSLQKSEFDATLDTVIAEHSDALANLVEGD